MWFDQRFVFDRNEIVNQRSKLYSITPLRFSNILHVIGNSPTIPQRYDHIARAHELLKPVRPEQCADEIASRSLEDGKKKRGLRMMTGKDLFAKISPAPKMSSTERYGPADSSKRNRFLRSRRCGVFCYKY